MPLVVIPLYERFDGKVFTIKKNLIILPYFLITAVCIWTNNESSSSGGHTVRANRRESIIFRLFALFIAPSTIFPVFCCCCCCHPVCIDRGDHRDLVASKVKERIKEEEKGKSRQPKLHIRERSDNIRTRKVKDSTIKIVRSEMMEEAKELFFFLLLLPRLYLWFDVTHKRDLRIAKWS